MIKYFYTGDDFYDGRYYSFAPKDKVPDSIPKYAKLYIVAEKYDGKIPLYLVMRA